MTQTIVAIIFISLMVTGITLTFAAYQEWRIKKLERDIVRCFKVVLETIQESEKRNSKKYLKKEDVKNAN